MSQQNALSRGTSPLREANVQAPFHPRSPFKTALTLHRQNATLHPETANVEAISDGNFDHDDKTCLMSMATTQTFNHLEVVRSSVTTMQSRMEMLLQGGWQGRAQVDFLKLRISGAKLSAQKVGSSFSSLFSDWTRSLSSSDTGNCSTMPTGTTPKESSPMWVPLGSNLSLEWYLSWLDGEESLLEMIR